MQGPTAGVLTENLKTVREYRDKLFKMLQSTQEDGSSLDQKMIGDLGKLISSINEDFLTGLEKTENEFQTNLKEF